MSERGKERKGRKEKWTERMVRWMCAGKKEARTEEEGREGNWGQSLLYMAWFLLVC